jgi:hypothetical protein
MKKSLQLSLALLTLVFSFTASATDLCVNENGNGGCYTTITAAAAAATNGDRILITPKAGNAPYVENVTVTKSLQFLCATEASQYSVQGNFSIVPAIGRTVTIIGMINLQGSVSGSTDGPTGARTKVSIMNCNFVNGSVAFDFNNFDVVVASNVFAAGNVTIRFGRVIGNDITATTNAVRIYPDGTATNDTILVIGNKLTLTGGYGVYSSTTSQFFSVLNNLIRTNYGGISVDAWKNSSLGRNTIINNTIVSEVNTYMCLSLYYSPANSVTDILNNLILAPSSSYGAMYGGSNSGLIGIYYNVISSPLNIQFLTADGTNNLTSNTTLDVNGRPNTGTDAINGGSPDYSYYDINLTVNDAGAYGGSFTLDNFFPQTGGARIYYVQAPRRVNVGTAIDIKAETFDR